MHIHIHGKTELKSAAFLIVGSYVKALLLFLTKLLFSEASHKVSVPTSSHFYKLSSCCVSILFSATAKSLYCSFSAFPEIEKSEKKTWRVTEWLTW